MAKAADAFRTISEVADDLDIPKHVLRFWENRFPAIRPMKRGGGRRYYRPEDVELLRGIKLLLHSKGFTIKGVQRILREEGVEHVKTMGREAGESNRDRATPMAMPLKRLRRMSKSGAAAQQKGRKATLVLIMRELDACRALLRPASSSPVVPGHTAPRRSRSRG